MSMKLIKLLFKILVICALLMAVIIGGIVLYMKYYGKDVLQDVLSALIKRKVSFEAISVSPDQYAINFKGFTIPAEVGFGEENVFNAERFSVELNEERFQKEGKVVVERIIIERGSLNIVRNRDGLFNLSNCINPVIQERGVAYAASAEGGAAEFYNFVKNVKALYIRDSVINFEDYFVAEGPFSIKCDELNVAFAAEPEKEPRYGAIPLRCEITFGMPTRLGRGYFKLDAEASVLENKIDADLNINTRDIDLMQFLPYFNSYTPFSFNEGVFSSETRFSVRDNYADSLTTIFFHRLNLVIDRGMENARFLEVSVNKLAPYLRSGRGDIVFDFVIKGPMDRPKIGAGPRVKFAMGRVVIEELGNMLQQIRKLRR